MSADFVQGDRIYSTAAKDVGRFFGIFSGEKKHRISLGGKDDKTNRLAIAYFDTIDEDSQFKKWVNLRLLDGTKNITVKADIASIAARLNISPSDIEKLAREDKCNNTHQLEEEINKKVKAYQDVLQIVKRFYQLVNDFLVFPKVDKIKLEETLSQIDSFDPSKIKNQDIQRVSFKCKEKLLNTLNSLKAKNFESKTVFHKDAAAEILPAPDIVKKNIDQAKTKIRNLWREFDLDFSLIDKNLSVVTPAPIVIRTLWDDKEGSARNLVLSTAKSMGSESSGKLAVRLQLFPGSYVHSVLTDGKTYDSKPKATFDYVPYSKDGKIWVLLSVKSLASRFHLNEGYVRYAAENGQELHHVIERFSKAVNDMNKLINDYKKEGVSIDQGLNSIKTFIGTLDKNNLFHDDILELAKELRDIINTSDTKAQSLARLEYLQWDPSKRTKIKITKDNVTEFINNGHVINGNKNIPLEMFLGGNKHGITVETDGFVYTKEPQSTEEYVAYQYKENYWVKLNVKSLENKTKVAIDVISEKIKNGNLNEFIDNLSEPLTSQTKKELVKLNSDEEVKKILNTVIDEFKNNNPHNANLSALDLIETLDKKSRYYSTVLENILFISTVFMNSASKAEAIARLEYLQSNPSEDSTKIKITRDNIGDFPIEGLFIDENFIDTEIPVKFNAEKHELKYEVETTGFVYTENPKLEFPEEYFTFKEGNYWIVLNKKSFEKIPL